MEVEVNETDLIPNKHSAGYSTFLDNDIQHGLSAQAGPSLER
jgi:hypothetical protein